MAARKGRSEGQMDFGFSSSAAKKSDEDKTPKAKKAVAAKEPVSTKASTKAAVKKKTSPKVSSAPVATKAKRRKKGAKVATAESMASR